jgi:hypothetical protein
MVVKKGYSKLFTVIRAISFAQTKSLINETLQFEFIH